MYQSYPVTLSVLVLYTFCTRFPQAFESTYEGPLENCLKYEVVHDMIVAATTLFQKHDNEEVLRTHGFLGYFTT